MIDEEKEKFGDLISYWREKSEAVENYLSLFLRKGEPRLLYESMRYSLFAGGKRFRPLLVILGYEVTGGKNWRDVVPIACSFELVHTFSLIHDDLPSMDDDDFRRGKPSNHRVFGEGVAILAGDALFSVAFEIALKAPIERDRILKIVELLAEASGPQGMIGGQVYDIEAEGVEATADLVREIHIRKTGKLIAAALTAGGVASGADDSIPLLEKIGMKLGMAFQITDDILDETGEEERLGKGVKKDKARGKCTYVSAFGLEKAREDARKIAEEAKALIGENFPGTGRLLVQLADFIVDRGY